MWGFVECSDQPDWYCWLCKHAGRDPGPLFGFDCLTTTWLRQTELSRERPLQHEKWPIHYKKLGNDKRILHL